MANHAHEITRFSFTEEALEPGSPHLERFPGFFSNGPEHFDVHLFNGETYINPVYALTLFIKTKQGLKLFTVVRSAEEIRQPDVASVVTARGTHAEIHYLMNAYSKYRVPILRGHVEEEGYHITKLDPRNPILVADYEPGAQVEGEVDDMLFSAFTRLIDKTQMRGYFDPLYDSQIDDLLKDVVVWPGPALMGISEVDTYFGKQSEHEPVPTINEPEEREEEIRGGGRPVMEAHAFLGIMGYVDLSHLDADEILDTFRHFNQHYSHFDTAPLDSFSDGAKDGNVDLVVPTFAAHMRSTYMKEQYLMACARGMCLRTAVAGLARHIAYVRNISGDKSINNTPDPIHAHNLYLPPKKLTLPTLN